MSYGVPRQPDGTSVTNTYHATGECQRTSGSRTYPVESPTSTPAA